MTDPISDLLTRVRNGLSVRKDFVLVPYSRIKWEIARLLHTSGYVSEVATIPSKTGQFEQIKIVLKYTNGRPVVRGLERMSRPGQRVYTPVNRLHRVLGGVGVMVVSTSQGIMTDTQARRANLGGEVLFKVW
ncbi:MAG: 30S ribosomal protein S8 [candidate division Kazan bacterium GW2011_GWC1_52_13]|nr:MAG: 30S ribosomal protein S8 [candidate division Kazan bacterium GW2011_GWC1_52_13]KKW26718.1 MAG: 30S ribosomal protein S8 [candidate division Kazan bacterium GW2011_GWB1_52_7]